MEHDVDAQSTQMAALNISLLEEVVNKVSFGANKANTVELDNLHPLEPGMVRISGKVGFQMALDPDCVFVDPVYFFNDGKRNMLPRCTTTLGTNT